MKKKARLENLVSEQAGIPLEKARGLILAGQVYTKNGARLDKPALTLAADETLDIRVPPRYVSRGGEKLEAALTGFGIDVSGVMAIDVGASTGGFTDCLLQHGARHVLAVDVGYGQFAWKLRHDKRVTLFERTNIRSLRPDELQERPDFFVVDCSFISLAAILTALSTLLTVDAHGVALIKPQFEAEKSEVEEGGVVRDPAVHEAVIARVLEAAGQVGFTELGVIPSPLLGPAGNKEFLVHLRREHDD
jgi:23S rRNA (cytidine1920-2'-O)/16S rRNA (cytidine1409-2'-O)-methyltransferase